MSDRFDIKDAAGWKIGEAEAPHSNVQRVVARDSYGRVIGSAEKQISPILLIFSYLLLFGLVIWLIAQLIALIIRYPKQSVIAIAISTVAGLAFWGVASAANTIQENELRQQAAYRESTRVVVEATAVAEASVVPSLSGRIAFTTGGDNKLSIGFIEQAQDSVRYLVQDGSNNIMPAWSRDGSRLAFASDRSGSFQIYVIDSDGGNLRQITDESVDVVYPSWSSDGGQLVVTRTDSSTNEWQIYTVDVTSLRMQLVSRDSVSDSFADWSPDGRKIVFTSKRDGASRLYTMDVTGENVQLLTPGKGIYDYPRWSPDGQYIAFSLYIGGSTSIYLMDANGGGNRQLSDDYRDGARNPSWSPDGRYICFDTKPWNSKQRDLGIIKVSNPIMRGDPGENYYIIPGDGQTRYNCAWGRK